MVGKCLRASAVAAVLIVTVAPAIAQTPPAAQQNEQRRDDRGLWGLLGLFGFIGLVGLKPKRRDVYDSRSNTTSTRLP